MEGQLFSVNKEKNIDTAKKILNLSRSFLFVDFKYMQRAVSRITLTEYEGSGNIHFASDGIFLYYNPESVVEWYKKSTNLVARKLLHTILHFVYYHNVTGNGLDREIWNLSCDIAVEYTINRLGKKNFYVPQSMVQEHTVSKLKEKIKYLNAESIYRYYINTGITQKNVVKIRGDFCMDEHSLWKSDENANTDDAINRIKFWKDVSRQVQTEISVTGDECEALRDNLAFVNRKKRSYADFLRRFGETGEILRISEDEFDNNYYSYGISLYQNIPLIENLEYREDKNIKEFVIAIDTSGSVKGETVGKFIQKTYELLKEKELFNTRVCIHVIQCDDRVRDDTIIKNDSDLERYIDTMKIIGLGKTDFRPVFDYVDELIHKKELLHPTGLIYFTDGQGIYPSRKPPYDTAFIIHTDEVYPPEVPAFAMRLILEEDMR